jgi:hypothetical protein
MRASSLFALLALSLAAGCEDGPYALPPGEFACGASFCQLSTQFCVLTTIDAGPATPSCAPLMEACGSATPTCSCVASECATPGTCKQNADGSIILSCSK